MVSISVKIEGLEKLQAGVAAGPAMLASETRLAMTAGSLLIEGTGRTLAPKDMGRLGGSITHVISGGGANLTSRIGPSVAYGIVIEKGRRPGMKAPPVKALAPWARRHGIPDGALFQIARSIGRKGIKARPFMVPALESNRGKVISLFARLGINVVNRMAN